MDNPQLKFRKYGFDILINRFEPLFREHMVNEVLLVRYGSLKWREAIPKGVIATFETEKDQKFVDMGIEDFFQEIYLWGLKEIAVFGENYLALTDLIPGLSKDKFVEVMDELNEIRKKIAHSKTFTQFDLYRLVELLKTYFSGPIVKDFLDYLDKEGYKDLKDFPLTITEETRCQQNLPIEEYDLDGGFVGRRKEINAVKKLLYSQEDRIISITGAGGVGKTAIALKTAYSILADENSDYDAIVWLSAKETKLTPGGIIRIEPEITTYLQLLKDILEIVDSKTAQVFTEQKMDTAKYVERLLNVFSSHRCLLVIDNLETIIKNLEIINFIKDIPRPSQVLITSRKGLGEIERRYPLPDFDERNAMELFRLIAREKNRKDLLQLPDETIKRLVRSVRCYPLLIKWSIGKICLGMDTKSAFSEIYSGKTEIAEFVFNDIFKLFNEDARKCLYCMIILGERPITKHVLMHLSGLDEDAFDDAIQELIVASFVYPEVTSAADGEPLTHFLMLSLTRGFIRVRLDEDKKTFNLLQTRYYELSHQMEQFEKSQMAYSQSLFSLGVKSDDEKIAFNYVKTAKNFQRNYENERADENFQLALRIAPNFAYAIIEYAKFEFSRDHIHEANVLFEKAIKLASDNYHAYFNFGMCLKKQNRIDEAISYLEKAKELNPEHLPIYNELGRAYTFKGNCEKANEFFEFAKTKKGPVNYKHLSIAISFQANNYKRWSEQYLERKDYAGCLEKLKEGKRLLTNAFARNVSDKLLQLENKDIAKNIAIQLCKGGRFDEARPFFAECLMPIVLPNGIKLTADSHMADAYYGLAAFGHALSKLSSTEVLECISKGMAIARHPNQIAKLSRLKEEIEGKRDVGEHRLVGLIKYVNPVKCYGLISSEDQTYLFFLTEINPGVPEESVHELKGRAVTFSLKQNRKHPSKKLAYNLILNS